MCAIFFCKKSSIESNLIPPAAERPSRDDRIGSQVFVPIIEQRSSLDALIAMNVRPMRPDSSFSCALACVTRVQRASTDAGVRRFRDNDPPNGWLVVGLVFCKYAVIFGTVLHYCQVPPGAFGGGMTQLRAGKPLMRKAHRKTRRLPESGG